MRNQIQELLEPDFYQLKIRSEELIRYFQLIRAFSVKVNQHLSIFSHLINDLVESEDNVYIEEKQLEIPHDTVRNMDHFKKQSAETQKRLPISVLSHNMEQECSQLGQILNRGEQSSQQIKDFFNKIIDQYSQQQDQKVEENQIYEKSLIRSPQQSIYSSEPQRQRYQSFTYGLNYKRKYEETLEELNKVKKQQNDGFQNIFEQYMDLKKEFESNKTTQEQEIKSLRNQVKNLKLKNQKQNHRNKSEASLIQLDQEINMVKSENNHLKSIIEDLEKENDDLIEKNRQLENQNQEEVDNDLLKCLFVQTSFIDQNNKFFFTNIN